MIYLVWQIPGTLITRSTHSASPNTMNLGGGGLECMREPFTIAEAGANASKGPNPHVMLMMS